MNAGQIISLFRSDVRDDTAPYLWSDTECLAYLSDAYSMFARLIGGIADSSSEACEVYAGANYPFVELHPSILRILSATREDNRKVDIVNYTDLDKIRVESYGRAVPLNLDTVGEVIAMVVGEQADQARLVQIPAVSQLIKLRIYRLPLKGITSTTSTLKEIDSMHHFHLIRWMEHLAYQKQDADAFNPQKSMEAGQVFRAYCQQVEREWERYKHKTRVVSYGGI